VLDGHARAVLEAPPGAGKTTRVPLARLEAPWVGDRAIVMLEPRRVAARAAAHYMARGLGEQPGDTVGYRVRLDTRVGPRTRIEVVTEGVLTRMLEEDPALERYGAVIFDEFHERSLHADLGLALALESQQVLRPDLRILVMSATLDTAGVAALLDDCPVVSSAGRTHPVEIRHAARRPEGRIEGAVAQTVRDALAESEGDVLVFLPGVGEIKRVEAALAGVVPAIVPLHGTLAPADQDRALRPDPRGRRKVILATSVAETSLTIDGVRVVVDGGLSRVPRFSPRTGMTRLETVRVSRASAAQRAGRAGRQAPGVCYRLWSAADEAGLVPYHAPEILEADLAPLALALAVAGAHDATSLRWGDYAVLYRRH
jgi:ATP-dependent helicase HrpB